MGQTTKENEQLEAEVDKKQNKASWLLYSINDVPPWHLSVLFGLQHCLLSISGLMGVPLLLATKICLADDDIGNQARAYLISSVFFASGLTTVLQCTIGNRLPILQGSSFAFLAATFAMLQLEHNQCPDPLPPGSFNSSQTLYNDTDGMIVDGEELWMRRVRQIQGSMAVASLVEVLLGLTGSVSFLLRFIGPLTITPTIALIGLDLFAVAPHHAETHWGIAVFTMVCLVLTSQYLSNVKVPLPAFTVKRKCHVKRIQIFKMLPVLISLVIGWILCWILTATDVLSPNPEDPTFKARADLRLKVLEQSPWFRIPYPGQWGLPEVSFAGVIGMIAGVMGSIIESIGDYYACAKLSGAPAPPKSAINRGIMMEGIGCVASGLIGSTTGTTSYSENIAAIGITRVGSRRVLQFAGALLLVMGCIGKFGGIFVTVPEPVIGGIFMVVFGMISAVGLSNLQFVDLNSARNIFIIGFSLFLGLSVPNWLREHPTAIHTGSTELDNICNVLLRSAMLVGGVTGMFLDNTLPGTEAERGIVKWSSSHSSSTDNWEDAKKMHDVCYRLPFNTNFRFAKYIPILPEFDKVENFQGIDEEAKSFTSGSETVI